MCFARKQCVQKNNVSKEFMFFFFKNGGTAKSNICNLSLYVFFALVCVT